MRKPDSTLSKTPEESAEVFCDHFHRSVFNRIRESSYEPEVEKLAEHIPTVSKLGELPEKKEIMKHLQ